MPENKDITEILVDVRKSYRLLYSYQDIVLDLSGEVASYFENSQFFSWCPMASSMPSPNRGQEPYDKNRWRFLPLYSFSTLFTFETNEEPYHFAKPYSLMLEANICSDCAFEETTDPEQMNAPEDSSSTFSIYMWQLVGGENQHWFNDIWWYYDWPSLGEAITTHYNEKGDEILKVSSHVVPLDNVISREDLEFQVEKAKSTFGKNLGITL